MFGDSRKPIEGAAIRNNLLKSSGVRSRATLSKPLQEVLVTSCSGKPPESLNELHGNSLDCENRETDFTSDFLFDA